MTGYIELKNAIIIQAIIDYRTALKNLSINYNVEKSQHMKSSVERFFRSEWFDGLYDLDGEFIMKKVREGLK